MTTTIWLVIPKDREFRPSDLHTHTQHRTKRKAELERIDKPKKTRYLWKVTKVAVAKTGGTICVTYE